MDSTADKMYKSINDLYNKKNFLDKYGSDIWLAVIITLVFFCISAYYYVLNNLEPIKADWSNKKCSPLVLPFAGLINKGPNETSLEFTSKNFTGCIQTILTNIVGTAFQPVYYIMKNLTDAFSDALKSVNSIRAMFDRVRTTIKDFSSETMGRTLNITMPIVQMIIGIKSMGAKMTGVLTATLFTLLGSYLTLQSFFLFLMELLTVILIALAAMIVTFLIISFIPIFGSWAIPVAATNIVIMTLILIPTAIIQIFMSNVLSLSTRSLPSIPRCFAGNTIVKLKNNICEKRFSTIEVGDVLVNGETVTAIMKFSASEQQLYNLGGVRVTGEHRVYHDKMGWIKVKYHPDGELIKDFSEPFVYCLGTDKKTFYIGNQLFSDWDDIDEHVEQCLKEKCFNYKTPELIHKYLDNGFIGSSILKLSNGDECLIENIHLNEYLENGEQVLGIIKIDATDLDKLQEYIVDENVLCGFNINVCFDNNKNKIIFNKNREKYLYQLLTNTGTFKINGIEVHDYNYGIDKYL